MVSLSDGHADFPIARFSPPGAVVSGGRRRVGLLCGDQLPVHGGSFPPTGAGRRRADQRDDQAGDARRHARQSQGGRAGHDFPAGRDARHCRHSHLRQDGPDRDVRPNGGDWASGSLADTETCRACHQDDRTTKAAILQPGQRAHEELRPNVLRHLSAIETEPGCVASGCHAHTANQPVLGVLDLEMSTAPMTAALRTAKGHFLWATAILAFVILAVVAVFIRRGLQRPISRLCAGTRRIAQGDLDTRIKVSGHGELAELAKSLNHMAEDLAAARHEVTQWSQSLERKVVEKTAELQQAQRQVLHMEKMASLGKLSATVAHEINNPLTGMLVYAGLTSARTCRSRPWTRPCGKRSCIISSVIERECRRCGGIVQNLLLFARRSGSKHGPGRRQRSRPPEPDARRAPSAHERPEAEGRVPGSRQSNYGGRRTIAAGPGGPAGQRRRGHERPARRAGRTGRRACTARADSIRIDIGDNGIGIPERRLAADLRAVFFHQGGRRTASDWGCRWSMGSSSGMAAGSKSTRKSASERRFTLRCRGQGGGERGDSKAHSQRQTIYAPAPCPHPDCRRRVLRPRLAGSLVPQGRLRGPDGGRCRGGDGRHASRRVRRRAARRPLARHGRHAPARADPPHRARDDRDHDHGLCLRRYGGAGLEARRGGLCHQADQSRGA